MKELTESLNPRELREIADKLQELEYETERETGVHWISGGFAIAEMFNYDDKFVDVELTWGTQSDCEDNVNKEQWKLNRQTMKWEE